MSEGVMARRLLSKRVPRSIMLLLVILVIAALFLPLYVPALKSYINWTLHPDAAFEKETIRAPIGWSQGEPWHLLSLKKPHLLRVDEMSSEIIIDPWAERHPGRSDQAWQFWSHWWERPIDFISGARCARGLFQEIDCLSPDNTVIFQFRGTADDFSAFRDVYRQATAITAKHPGMIRR